jgi:hypothetical protein
MKKILFTHIGLLLFLSSIAQVTDSTKLSNEVLDSIYIVEFERSNIPALKPKVLHAEPLYIDLIRDLGAHKGEKEWNVGFGMLDYSNYDRHEALVEYEWAPIDRLGLEVELPFSFYYPLAGISKDSIPKNRMESLKLAAQWSFFVSEKLKTSLAIGYIHEFEITAFKNYGRESFFTGNVFNPFFIAAKRWGSNFHTLIYTGPSVERSFNYHSHFTWEIHTNFHYMIPGTRNFIGVEFNKEYDETGDFDMIIRPQMRVGISENLMIGIVTGIPFQRETERFSSFIRLIYEPKHKHK